MKKKIYQFLNWLSKYTKTDMVYVVEGSFWWIVGRIFSFLASFAILFTFSHFASKDVYGAYQYIISTVSMLGVLSLPGLEIALAKAVAKGKEKTFFLCEKTRLKWSTLVFFSSLAISLWYFFHQNFTLALPFLFAAIFFPFLSTFSLYNIFWYGKKRFDIQNKTFILHNIIGAIIFILFIFFQPKIPSIIFGYFFSFTLATFLFWFYTRKKIIKDSEEDKEAISFGKHLTIMGIPATISSQIDNFILWQFSTPQMVAIYAYALRLVERISETIPFSQIAFPKMVEKNLKAIKKSVFDKFKKLFPVSLFLYLCYFLFSPLLFKIFFPAYWESLFYSRILALTFLFLPFYFLSNVFTAEGKKKELYVLSFLPQFLKIFLFFLLIPIFQIGGAVSAILISNIVFACLVVYYFQKI